jgi:hypothetical protein
VGAAVASVCNGTRNVSAAPMGGAAPSKIPDHETNSLGPKHSDHEAEAEVDSKLQSDDLQKMALGETSQSSWSDQKHREYSEFKKTKSNTVDWSESNSSSGEQKSSSPVKASKPKPAPPTKPRPPANRPPSISNQPKTPSKGSLRSDLETSPVIRESQPKMSSQKYAEMKQNDESTFMSMNSDQSSTAGSRIISKVQKCVDESSDSDENEEASAVYDWTLSLTQGPLTHPEIKFSQISTRTEPIPRDAPTPKHLIRSVSDKDDELIADLRDFNPPLEPHVKPNIVPVLHLPSDGSFHSSQEFKQIPIANPPRMTMTLPPRAQQKSGPLMATGGPRGPIPVRGPPVIRTNGPSPTAQRLAVPPSPNHYMIPQMNRPPQEHHQVKETKDVKRNRAQIPSTLTHAKPTTGDWLKKRYIVNNFILLDLLGTGSYGEVKLCKDRTTDKLYAMKIFSKEMLKKKKGGNTSETYFDDIKQEIAIMKKLSHPNVLKLFEVLDDPNVRNRPQVLSDSLRR